jgi:hypothetical protein
MTKHAQQLTNMIEGRRARLGQGKGQVEPSASERPAAVDQGVPKRIAHPDVAISGERGGDTTRQLLGCPAKGTGRGAADAG